MFKVIEALGPGYGCGTLHVNVNVGRQFPPYLYFWDSAKK